MTTLLVSDENGECEVIGTREYSIRHRTPKAGSKSILPDMNNLPVDQDIKAEAEAIYHRMGAPTRKDDGRKELVFSCLHFAYAELYRIHSPKELATILILDPSRISKIVGKFSLSKVNYHPPQRFYIIEAYTIFLADKISLTHDLRELAINLAQLLPVKDPSLQDLQPDLVAGGIIVYTQRLFSTEDNPEVINLLNNLIICNASALATMATQLGTIDNQ